MTPNTKKLNLVVLMGGPSSEHEISLKTGKTIIRNLNPEKYNLKPVTVTKEGTWLLPKEFSYLVPTSKIGSPERGSPVALPEKTALSCISEDEKTDMVFIAMHGEYGEDGKIQGLLEVLGIPYTGSGVLASSLGMNKPASLRIFRDRGLAVPDFLTLKNGERIAPEAIDGFGLPLVVKPADRGSSVGISIIDNTYKLGGAIDEAFRFSNEILVQRYIQGREITCGVIDNGLEAAIPLQPTEIIPKEKSFFDYYSKYTPHATEEITPPRLPKLVIEDIQHTALITHSAIGCSGMSRTDMILDENFKLWVLEINTIPGLTETSLLPQAARAVGIDFPELLDRIIEAALNRKL